MVTSLQRRVALWLTAVGLAVLIGGGAYLAAREDPPAPTTTTTTAPPTLEEVAAEVAATLRAELDAPLTDEQARCVADRLLAVVPPPLLRALADRDEPLTGVPPEDRDDVVRAVVTCVPPEVAAELLGGPTTTTEPLSLPDEG